MRIANIITDLDTGGTQISLLRLLSRLSPCYCPHVISLSTAGNVGNEIKRIGVSIEALGMKPGCPNPLLLIRLIQRLKTLKPDAVHTWMYHADLVGGLAAWLAGVPAISWAIRNTDLSKDKTKRCTRTVVRICAMLSHKIPDRIVSCSHASQEFHISLGYDSTRFLVIPNGFDLLEFRPDPIARGQTRHELGISSDVFLIGLVARFDREKNHAGFFQAAGILHNKHPDVHFILVGKGMESSNSQVSTWVQDAGIKDVTHLLGMREDIPRLTAAFDLASSFSWGESFPNTIGEAMACGVPCVVTDVGDSAYLVSDTGLIVKPGDVYGLTVAWEKLLRLRPDERRSLGKRARARVAEHFEIGDIVRRYESFYDELAAIKRDKQSNPCNDQE